ncbi:MAG: glycosyltransferase family 87 protein [Acidobacteriota bacterium]
MPATGSPLRKIAAAGILAAGACLVVAILVFGVNAKTATGRDFLQYWALERQLAHGANPYDEAALLRIERSVGMDKPGALMSLSPPVGFAFAVPLGWVAVKPALIMWLLLLLACVSASVSILWLLHGRPHSRWHVIAIGFPPTLWCLISGQLGIFFLLDIVLFLYFVRSRPWLAGASLVLAALKPHLFLPFGVALLAWSLFKRDFRVLLGFAAALAIACGSTLALDPRVWTEYARMMRANSIVDQFIPTIGMLLRFGIHPAARWIEFVPEAGACLWAAWYFLARRKHWDWNREGLLVLLVSVACTPYSWYCDQTLLFPAILVGLYRAEQSVVSLALFLAITGAGMVGFLAQIPMTSSYYVWTAPAWLLWYLYATRKAHAPAAAAPGPASAAC